MSKYTFIVILLSFLYSCNLLDDQEDLPAYIYIDSVDFVAEPDEGTADQEIPHIWMNIGGDFVGAFEHPRLIPLNYEGSFNCIVNPGIVNNGINSLYEINEVMTRFEQQVDLVRGEIDTIYPVFRYDDTAGFGLIEDFDNGTTSFNENLDGNNATRMRVTPAGDPNVLSGKSGLIKLTARDSFVQIATSQDITDIPVGSGQKILEVQYKNDISVVFGILYYEDNETRIAPAFGLNPSQDWNKVYLNYTTLIRGLNADRIRIVIQAQLPDGLEEGSIYFDNIKFTYEN